MIAYSSSPPRSFSAPCVFLFVFVLFCCLFVCLFVCWFVCFFKDCLFKKNNRNYLVCFGRDIPPPPPSCAFFLECSASSSLATFFACVSTEFYDFLHVGAEIRFITFSPIQLMVCGIAKMHPKLLPQRRKIARKNSLLASLQRN